MLRCSSSSTTAPYRICNSCTTTTTASLRAARALLLLPRRPPPLFLLSGRRSASAAAAAAMAPSAAEQQQQQQQPPDEHPHEHLLRLGACGRVAPDRYEDQLALKLERLRALFASSGPSSGGSGSNGAATDADPTADPVPIPERIQVFRSAPTHFRMRAEFQVWLERKPREEREAAAAATAAAAAAATAAGDRNTSNGATPEAAATTAEDDGVTDLYFIMHERVPAPPEQPPAKENEDEIEGEGEQQQHDDKQPPKDAAAAAADGRPEKRRRRSFRRRRSERASASAPAGLAAAAASPDDHHQQAPKFKMQRVRIDDFPAGSRLVNSLMRLLRRLLLEREPLRRRLFQVNFHTTLSGQAMVTLVYHRALDAAWEEEARRGREWLLRRLAEEAGGAEGPAVGDASAAASASDAPGPRCTELQLIGRCRGKRIDVERNWVEEEMDVRPLPFGEEGKEEEGAGGAAKEQQHQRVRYRQVEMSFSQPNAGMCRQMLGWALDVTRAPPKHQQQPAATTTMATPTPTTNPDNNNNKNDHDLLELYCGNGNFSVPLAANFRRVLATEVSSTSVDAARHNAHANGLGPPPPPPATADGYDGQPEATDPPARLFVARLSAEEFSDTWRTGAARRRLEGLGGGGLGALDLKTALVDPPRAGLDDLTRALLLDPRFQRVVYVSCNPVTLKRDLALLTSVGGAARAWAAMAGAGGGGSTPVAADGERKDGEAAAADAAAPAARQPQPTPYRIERFAAFDQFPYTEHLECGAYLVRDD